MPRAVPTTTYIKFKKLRPDAQIPKQQTSGSAGMDLHAYLPNQKIVLGPREWKLIPCGFAMAIEPGYEAQVRPRSSLANNDGVTVLNTPGTIDSDYRGEVGVILINLSNLSKTIQHGERIAQMVIHALPVVSSEEVDELDKTERGTGGFGSTGKT
jgi:dUTP pyrophosphatase